MGCPGIPYTWCSSTHEEIYNDRAYSLKVSQFFAKESYIQQESSNITVSLDKRKHSVSKGGVKLYGVEERLNFHPRSIRWEIGYTHQRLKWARACCCSRFRIWVAHKHSDNQQMLPASGIPCIQAQGGGNKQRRKISDLQNPAHTAETRTWEDVEHLHPP